MHKDRWDLLRSPLIRVRTAKGHTRASLPQLLAMLGRNEVEGYPGLQRHQEDPWHVFLVQLATMALARSDRSDPVQDEAFWRDALLQLSEGKPSAWRLVEPDLSEPAFFQPPWSPVGKPCEPSIFSADGIDALSVAKNHDLKSDRSRATEADVWLFSLMSLQTTAGYFGSGNHGIARMNGGLGSRIIVELVHDLRWGVRFCDAVVRALAHRSALCEENRWGYDPQGIALLWLLPWDGKKGSSRALAGLDPMFVEICRIVRLVETESGLAAATAPTKCPRLSAAEMRGVVGDPWTPIREEKDSAKALTLNEAGFTAERQRQLLFEDGIKLSILQKPLKKPGELRLIGSAIVRGQGRTDGFHAMELRVPEQVRSLLFGGRRDELNERAKQAIELTDRAERKALKPAVFLYLQGAPDQVQLGQDETDRWWRKVQTRFRQRWEGELFPWLWRTAERDEQDAYREWVRFLVSEAKKTLQTAMQAMPTHQAVRWKARVRAEGMLWGLLRKHLSPFLDEEEERHAA